MRALILAAGRGKRMRHLTEDRPKPLLEVAGRALIVHRIEALRTAGFRHLVINLGYRGDQLHRHLGNGRTWDVHIEYSREPHGALETAGALVQARPLLGEAPFVLVNADLWCDYPLHALRTALQDDDLAHLVLVDNPPQHPKGDFSLAGRRVLDTPGLTYSGIAVLHPRLTDGLRPGPRPLAPLLRRAITADCVSGEHYHGTWHDIGTPERLEALRAQVGSSPKSKAIATSIKIANPPSNPSQPSKR